MESYFLLYDQPLIAPALASEVLLIFPSSKVTDQPIQGCQFSRLKSFAFCFCRLRQIKDNKQPIPGLISRNKTEITGTKIGAILNKSKIKHSQVNAKPQIINHRNETVTLGTTPRKRQLIIHRDEVKPKTWLLPDFSATEVPERLLKQILIPVPLSQEFRRGRN